MDPEASLRKRLLAVLSQFFHVWEEVCLTTASSRIARADILFVANHLDSHFAVAIEIKSQPPKQPKNYRDTFLQALQYVGATITDDRVPRHPIPFAFVHQHRTRWKRRLNEKELIDQHIMDSLEMDGIELAFNSLNVGHTAEENSELSLRLSHNRLWSSRSGWSVELQRRLAASKY